MTSPVLAAEPQRSPEALLRQMTLEEKVAQLHQAPVGTTDPNNVAAEVDARPEYGSYLFSSGRASAAVQRELRRRADRSRLRIPPLFGADVIHGYSTIFPIPLAQACSWDLTGVRDAARVAGEEAAPNGVQWTFAPMVDIALDPRWGRIAETFGESPYASAHYCVASVEGYRAGGLASCLKHYVGYGASEGGRDYTYTDVSRQRLWELYLPSFAAGIRAGAETVMSGFNDLDGIPASANRYTLTDVLRGRLGFRGFVVSDWGAVAQLIPQGFAADPRAAAAKALGAGVDMDMADGLYRSELPALIRAGVVPAAAVDEAVRRVLAVKQRLGLLDGANGYARGESDAGQAVLLARRLASESVVLLKNQGTLPLPPGTGRIAVIGPLADDARDVLGSWRQAGRDSAVVTVAAAAKAEWGARCTVSPGCAIEGDDRSGFAAALAAARGSDAVILCLGESGGMSGENASRSSIRLPGRQQELAQALEALGKPVVLVLFTGRPVEIAAIEPGAAAVIAAWQPGTETGAALIDILTGRTNPSGRLAVTWPRTEGQIPLYLGMRPRARKSGGYQDGPTTPLYPFGYGLSYTTFGYGALHRTGDGAAEVAVTNRGAVSGRETVFWYTHQWAGEITRPQKELRYFESALLAPGETRRFRYVFEPRKDWDYPDANGDRIAPQGRVDLMAGPTTLTLTLR